MSKTVDVSLTAKQIDMLRGVLYEFYSNFDVSDEDEVVRLELEEILGNAEDEIYQSN